MNRAAKKNLLDPLKSLRYTCHCCRRHCAAVVVSLSSAETRPSIRAVQRCFVRSNSISEFLYRTHHISKQTPGQCARRCLHKASDTHNTPRVWEQTPHSFAHLRGGGCVGSSNNQKLLINKCVWALLERTATLKRCHMWILVFIYCFVSGDSKSVKQVLTPIRCCPCKQ